MIRTKIAGLPAHTIRHAIDYLGRAAELHAREGMPTHDALRALDPGRLCAAYGVAKTVLRDCDGVVDDAIAQLQSREAA